ncbi:MAG: ABC transporter permease [Methanomassiliicoccales archaeon]|nr:ABC transporter permease [Methanomassiliicoccales archaeon]
MTNRVIVALKGEAKGFYRNKSTMFWTIAFPLLLILLFGAIFSASDGGTYDLYVQDLSDSQASHQFLEAVNHTGSVNLKYIDKEADLDQYIKDHSLGAVLIVPANFQAAFIPGAANNTTQLAMRLDPSQSSSNIVFSIVSAIANQANLALSNGGNIITMGRADITSSGFNYIDFFIPGVIALTTMTTTIFWMVSVMTRYRNNGIFKKLTTTPITRMEWLLSQILWQLFVVFLSVAVIMIVGMLAFNTQMTLNPVAIITIILSSALFSSMGMIIARFIKEEEAASAAANAITFPMMFLAGIFFPLSMFPTWLASIANVLPLTYVGNALRDSMVYDNIASATNNMLVVAGFAIVMFIAGIVFSKWKTE